MFLEKLKFPKNVVSWNDTVENTGIKWGRKFILLQQKITTQNDVLWQRVYMQIVRISPKNGRQNGFNPFDPLNFLSL